MRIRLKADPIILLFALALAACSGAVVTPNRTNPAFIGTYGPAVAAGIKASRRASVTAVQGDAQHARQRVQFPSDSHQQVDRAG